eukprot:gene8902-1246_t
MDEKPYKRVCTATLAGMLTFPGTLGLLQKAIMVPLRIRAHQRFIGTIAGCFAVSTAGVVSTIAYQRAHSSYNQLEEFVQKLTSSSSFPSKATLILDAVVCRAQKAAEYCAHIPHTCRTAVEEIRHMSENPVLYGQGMIHSGWFKRTSIIVASTLGVFFFLGGRPRRVLPSSLWHKGAFSFEGLPAYGANYATPAQRTMLCKMGRIQGCHTCGTRSSKVYHGDHVPPNKLANGKEQVFLPQCTRCSNLQGPSVRSGQRLAITHATTFRRYHMWFPLSPFLLSIMFEDTKTGCFGYDDMARSNIITNGGRWWSSPAPSSALWPWLGKRKEGGMVDEVPSWIEMGRRTLGFLSALAAVASLHATRLWHSVMTIDSQSILNSLRNSFESIWEIPKDEETTRPFYSSNNPDKWHNSSKDTSDQKDTTSTFVVKDDYYPTPIQFDRFSENTPAHIFANTAVQEEIVLSVQHTLIPSTSSLTKSSREAVLSAHRRLSNDLSIERLGHIGLQSELWRGTEASISSNAASHLHGKFRSLQEQRKEELLEDDLAMLGVEMRLLSNSESRWPPAC